MPTPPESLPPFQLKYIAGKQYIFDVIRKKYVVLSPEEGVRQELIRELIHQRKVPKGLIAVERGLVLNGRTKRFDLFIADRAANPLVLIECKAPHVKIDQAVFDQLAAYNLFYKAPLLIVSNGLQRYYCKLNFESKAVSFVEDLGVYPFEV